VFTAIYPSAQKENDMEGTALLIWGMLFGAIGLGFFTYGKRQQAIVPLISGIGLFVFPYFVPNVYLLVLVGAIWMALPYFIRI
jgi:predicted membrane protein